MLNIRKRLALGVAVVALHLAAGQSAWAGLAFTGTLTDWLAGVAPVINGDKEFNAQAASPEMILANPSVSIDKIGADYSVTLSFDVGGLDGPFSGWIQFGVAILDPNQVFNSVRIDSTHLGSANSSLQKDLDWGGPGVDATIMSVNGSTQTTFAAAGQSLLIITDYVTIDTGANVATFVNTFTQKSKVPEPALWQALVGLAAVGLVVRKRGRN